MSSPRILIVEDDFIIGYDLKKRLESKAFQVTAVVDNGPEAVLRARRDAPDLVLMDIILRGDMTGIEAAEKIQSNSEIPVVFISAHADRDRIEKALRVEPFGFIVKPFYEREVFVTIEMALYKASAERRRKQADHALRQARDELEQRVRERTAELTATNQAMKNEIQRRYISEKALRESEERFREMAELLPTAVVELDNSWKIKYINKMGMEMFGYAPGEIGESFDAEQVVHPGDLNKGASNLRIIKAGNKPDPSEYRLFKKDGSELIGLVNSSPIFNGEQVTGVRITISDITNIKNAEKKLQAKEKQLQEQTRNLEEVNTTLKVLLEHIKSEKSDQIKNIQTTLHRLVLPYVGKLMKAGPTVEQKFYLNMIENNLNRINSSFTRRMTSAELTMTPTEVEVAMLIRDGKSTKEIAGLLCLSSHTIDSHRKKIRKKLGISDRGINLKNYLKNLYDQ